MMKRRDFGTGGTMVTVWARKSGEKYGESARVGRLELMPTSNTINIHSQMSFQKFHFDNVFHATFSQKHLYEVAVKPVVEKVLKGSDGGIIRYGQTENEDSFVVYEGLGPCQCGIAVRAFEDILKSKFEDDKVEVSFVQLHMDHVYDLLAPTKGTSILGMSFSRRWSKCYSDMLVDASEIDLSQPSVRHIDVADMESLLKLLKSAQKSRAIAANLAHTSVANTHAVLTMTLKKKSNPQMVRSESAKLASTRVHFKTRARGFYDSNEASSRLIFVDLGTKLSDGEDSTEILALGKCLKAKANSISSPDAGQESKLTKFLRPVFDEPAFVSVIITIGTSDSRDTETFRALEFGQQSMRLRTSTEILRSIGEDAEMVICEVEGDIEPRSESQRGYYIGESSQSSPMKSSTSSSSQLDLDDDNKRGEIRNKTLTHGGPIKLAAEREKPEREIEGLKMEVERSIDKHRHRKSQLKDMDEQLREAREQAAKYLKLWEASTQEHKDTIVQASERLSQEIAARKEVEVSVAEIAQKLAEAQVNVAILMNSRALAREENALRIKQAQAELAQEMRLRVYAEGLLSDYMTIRKKMTEGKPSSHSTESAAEQIEQLELEVLRLKRMVKEEAEGASSKEEAQNKELQDIVHKFLIPDSKDNDPLQLAPFHPNVKHLCLSILKACNAVRNLPA